LGTPEALHHNIETLKKMWEDFYSFYAFIIVVLGMEYLQ
jgi:hypothetical protein